ncbi:hypothetical protein LPW41_13690 [Microbacterium sp. JC 701]|uniref:hypothetical protein n=1 Tax=Microbacterium sp. JC 701 TaxID=2897389 RepID=UPI001E4702E8|nr:hypothetical protein [Microbacterium sp. JC 701]MCD2170749.1 hypothetical protein [Microbacterium sp. JC 701]
MAGLLPWLLTGPFLPLQNLGEGQDPAKVGPFVMLPYSQYAITTIIVLLVVGGVFAGIIARARRSRPGLARSFAALGGLVIVQVVAIVQTAATTRSVLQQRHRPHLHHGVPRRRGRRGNDDGDVHVRLLTPCDEGRATAGH